MPGEARCTCLANSNDVRGGAWLSCADGGWIVREKKMARSHAAFRSIAAVAIAVSAFSFAAKAAPLVVGPAIPVPAEADPTGGTFLAGSPLVSNFSGGAGPTAFS